MPLLRRQIPRARGLSRLRGHKLSYAGTGTQRIVAELENSIPRRAFCAWINDTTSGKRGTIKF